MPRSDDLPLDTILEPIVLTYRELMGIGLCLEVGLANLETPHNQHYHDAISHRLTGDTDQYRSYADMLDQINDKLVALAEGSKFLYENGDAAFANISPEDFGTPK